MTTRILIAFQHVHPAVVGSREVPGTVGDAICVGPKKQNQEVIFCIHHINTIGQCMWKTVGLNNLQLRSREKSRQAPTEQISIIANLAQKYHLLLYN